MLIWNKRGKAENVVCAGACACASMPPCVCVSNEPHNLETPSNMHLNRHND